MKPLKLSYWLIALSLTSLAGCVAYPEGRPVEVEPPVVVHRRVVRYSTVVHYREPEDEDHYHPYYHRHDDDEYHHEYHQEYHREYHPEYHRHEEWHRDGYDHHYGRENYGHRYQRRGDRRDARGRGRDRRDRRSSDQTDHRIAGHRGVVHRPYGH